MARFRNKKRYKLQPFRDDYSYRKKVRRVNRGIVFGLSGWGLAVIGLLVYGLFSFFKKK